MSETFQESGKHLENLGLQKVWDLATELVRKHGVSDEEYGVMSATWVYSSDNDAIMVEDFPGMNLYGGSKASPQLGIYFGKSYHDRWCGPSFNREKEFAFSAGEAGCKLYGTLRPGAVRQVIVTDHALMDRGQLPPTPTETTEIELILSFAIADLANQKRRQIAGEHLTKAALLESRLTSRNGKLEYIDTWLASLIEEYKPED